MSLFAVFKKKNNNTYNSKHISYNFQIKYSTSSPTKLYEITGEESKFIIMLLSKAENIGLSPKKFRFIRMSNGIISVDYDYFQNGGFVGKVKLQGRKTYILYMKNLYDSATVDGDIDECLKGIDYWLAYIKKYFK